MMAAITQAFRRAFDKRIEFPGMLYFEICIVVWATLIGIFLRVTGLI